MGHTFETFLWPDIVPFKALSAIPSTDTRVYSGLNTEKGTPNEPQTASQNICIHGR